MSPLKTLHSMGLMLCLGLPLSAFARDYIIDTQGMHASVQFKIQHLGYSWLTGRFDDFDGSFSFDKKHPENAHIEITVQTASINSNHAERDKHLREANFLGVTTYPEATFVSTAFSKVDKDQFELKGLLTLHGVSKPITMQVKQVGAGRDPWGGYRRGFEGTLDIVLADYDMTYGLGYKSRKLELSIYLEGIRQKKK